MYICTYVYMYIYIYIYRSLEIHGGIVVIVENNAVYAVCACWYAGDRSR